MSTNPCTICGSEMKENFPTGITRRGTCYGTTRYKPSSGTTGKKYKIVEVDTFAELIMKNKEAILNNDNVTMNNYNVIYQVKKDKKTLPTSNNNDRF